MTKNKQGNINSQKGCKYWILDQVQDDLRSSRKAERSEVPAKAGIQENKIKPIQMKTGWAVKIVVQIAAVVNIYSNISVTAALTLSAGDCVTPRRVRQAPGC